MTSAPPLVLGFVGENANATLAASTNGLNALLAARGIEAHTIDTARPDWSERLREFVTARQLLFAYGYAGVGSVMRNGAQSFWTAFRTPFLSLMYDHPFYNLANHTVDSPWVANCYFIADYTEMQTRYVKNPHACFVLREGVAPSEGDFLAPSHWAKRPHYGVFVKSIEDPAKVAAAVAELDRVERELYQECLETLQQSADHLIADLVAMRARFKNFARPFNDGALLRMVLLLDRTLRDWRARRLVEWLKHKPVLIIGSGWDTVDQSGAAAKFLPARPFAELEALYRDSRFVFNTNPYARDGHHERVMMAIKAGAVAISDRNRFSDQNLAGIDNFVSFDWGDAGWEGKLEARLDGFEKATGGFDARAGQAKLLKAFPLDSFLTGLLNAAEEVRRRTGQTTRVMPA